MRDSIKPLLLGGVAVAAMTIGGVGASTAAAQCATSGSTVTCAGATTDTQAQQAINGATAPNLTLVVNQGATIASAQRQITIRDFSTPIFVPPNGFVNSPAFTGTVSLSNAGVIGTSSTQSTDIRVTGASRFSGVNSGLINGSVIVGPQFGGASNAGTGSFVNTGTVTGLVSLQGSGDQSYTGSGAIQGAPFPSQNGNGLALSSQLRTSTSGANNRFTTTVTGGSANATVDGVFRSTGTSPVFLGVSVTGIAGANAGINGQVGNVTVLSRSANEVNGTTFVNGGFDSTNNSQAVGGAATLTVGTTGAVNGGISVTGLTGATATINGTVNRNSQSNLFLVVVAGGGSDTTSTSLSTSSSGTSTRNDASSSTSRLGDATALIASTATVNGGLFVSGTANATATVRGAVTGPINLTSQSGDGASSSNSSSAASSSNSSRSSRFTSRGGVAVLTVDAGGSVGGEIMLNSTTSATATIDGRVGMAQSSASVSISASSSDSTSSGSSAFLATGSTFNSQSGTTVRNSATTLTLGSSGVVTGGVTLSNATTASATIAGTIGTAQNRAGLNVATTGSDTSTSSSSTSSSNAATGSTSNTTDTRTSRAGAANVTVAGTGRVAGSVNVSGGTGATAVIDGTVATAPSSFGGVFVSTGGTDGTTSSTSTFTAGSGSVQTREDASSARGGAASVAIGTTGSVLGSVSATSTRGAASATLAGTAGIASSSNFTSTTILSATASGNDTRNTSTFGSSRNASSNMSTAVGGQASATVLAGGVMIGSVAARGDAGATIANAGTVGRALQLTAGANNTSSSNNFGTSTTTTGGVTTSIGRSTFASNNASVAADGSVTNTGTAASVNASATSNLTFRNDGTVTGGIGLTAAATTFDSTSERTTTTTQPATGGATTVETNSGGSTSQAVGGTIVATYNGTVGTTPVDPRQAQRTDITQSATVSSTATVAGLILGSVTSSTGGVNTTTSDSSVTTTQPPVGTGTSGATQTTVTANRSSRTIVGGPSSVVVSGAVRNDGTGNGGVTVRATTGSANATVSGGTIEGGLVVTAGRGANTTTSFDATTVSTLTNPTPFFTRLVEQSTNTTSSTVTRFAGGTAAATLAGANVGSVQVSGIGTGAGSAAATAMADASSTIGAFTVAAGGRDRRDDETNTLANGIRTIVTTRTDTVSTAAGTARADVAGRINGAAAVTSQGGAATFNLTGVAADLVTVTANTFDRNSTMTQTVAVTNTPSTTLQLTTGTTTVSSTTARGGVATLAVASAGAVQTAGTNAIGGAVTVDGFGGSVLTVATGSRLLTNNGGTVRVGGTATSGTATTISSFDPTTGAFTGSTSRQTFTSAAGAAGITNAGVIGAPTAYLSAPVTVRGESVGGVTIANTGQIYGNVIAAGIGERSDVTTIQTPAGTTTPLMFATTTMFTPIGAAAAITNAGVISGRAEVVAATGSITNTGVIRGTAQLGSGVRNYTNTVTSTSVTQSDGTLTTTSVTAPATPSATLFGQTLALDQSGLVLGGVRVEGATTADPANGAAIRTATINATVNLNQGSITLGDVTGQQDASGRLTRTAVNLSGDGFLGAGPTLQPIQTTSAVGFAATPNYATFAAIDPALGTVGSAGFTSATILASGSRMSGVDSVTKTGTVGSGGSGGFTPATVLTSGSRISGVDSVTKTGGGAFTIVGAPLLSTGGTTTFTIDAPLVRVASGEMQLGMAGVDPATGQGVFGIRGAVQNDGVLVLGRRIASGTLTGVQGLTLSVAGNVTQGAGGTLVIAASPQPALQITPTLATAPSFLVVDGALSLGGTVSVAAPQGIYLTGRGPDFASVGGTFTSTATMSASGSPFVSFGIVTRVEGGRTIVSTNVMRTPFASVAANGNAAAGGGVLQAAISTAVAAGAASDLATVILGLDTGSAARAAGTLDELGQASFYGSLAAVSITRPFGEVSDALAGIGVDRERPVSLWMRMGGSVARIDGDAGTGARRLTGNNVGATVGVDASSGSVRVGIGGGPGWTDAGAGIGRARANGWMLGAYAAGRFGPLSLAGQAVAGWSTWNASRTLQSFGRYATATFDQREIRLNGRAAIDLSVRDVLLSPFVGVEWRQWRLDGFSERNAGALGLNAGRIRDSVLSPEAGARIAGTTGGLRAFVEGAYVFQGDIATDRAFSLIGAPRTFTVRGVKPGDFGRIGSGLEADIGRGSFFVRGDVWTGGGNRQGTVRIGARVRL